MFALDFSQFTKKAFKIVSLKIVTTCSVRFFGSEEKEIQSRVRNHLSNDAITKFSTAYSNSSCINPVSKLNIGDSKLYSYPLSDSYECNWMRENDVVNERNVITGITIQFSSNGILLIPILGTPAMSIKLVIICIIPDCIWCSSEDNWRINVQSP